MIGKMIKHSRARKAPKRDHEERARPVHVYDVAEFAPMAAPQQDDDKIVSRNHEPEAENLQLKEQNVMLQGAQTRVINVKDAANAKLDADFEELNAEQERLWIGIEAQLGDKDAQLEEKNARIKVLEGEKADLEAKYLANVTSAEDKKKKIEAWKNKKTDTLEDFKISYVSMIRATVAAEIVYPKFVCKSLTILSGPWLCSTWSMMTRSHTSRPCRLKGRTISFGTVKG